MDIDHLHIFYDQESVRDAVRDFMRDLLDERALKSVYKGENVSGYKEAREVVDRLFSRLEETYGKRDKSLSSNPSR